MLLHSFSNNFTGTRFLLENAACVWFKIVSPAAAWGVNQTFSYTRFSASKTYRPGRISPGARKASASHPERFSEFNLCEGGAAEREERRKLRQNVIRSAKFCL